MNALIQLKETTAALLAVLLLACFAISPTVKAVVPPPDGGYPGFTTAEGQNALKNLTSGSGNTGVGWYSLFSATTASFNTATGAGALLLNTADENTAFGAAALLFNTTGINNTAVGATALLHYTIAEGNTATGAFALSSNTEGDFNTATGFQALLQNTGGVNNTANGVNALSSNTNGFSNTATGAYALFSNTIGEGNTATGYYALFSNTSGSGNTATGDGALSDNTTGTTNTATGFDALFLGSGNDNTATDASALRNNAGSTNSAFGRNALSNNSSGNNNIALRAGAGSSIITASDTICIGAAGVNVTDGCYIGHIFQEAIDPDNLAMAIDVHGKLGTPASSRRFKDDIKSMNKASEVILALKPVTFHYKNDAKCSPRFGLIAEEVAEVDPNLVASDKDGKPYSVRYDQVNAMLLNEFLKEHRKNEQQRI
jgi:hypothetical protein